MAKHDAFEEIRKQTGGHGAHYARECSSSPDPRLASVRCLRTWGTVCFVGEGGTMTLLEVSPDMLRRQITMIGLWTFAINIQDECTRFIADEQGDAAARLNQRNVQVFVLHISLDPHDNNRCRPMQRAALYAAKNSRSCSLRISGCSSGTKWPHSGITTPRTLLATRLRLCWASLPRPRACG